jgi:site-specific DNA recombinase
MKYRYEKIGLSKRTRTLRPESEWIPIPVPAIVDTVTWQAAQKQLQENKNFAKRNLKHDYLLNGLVTCASCGRAMIVSYSGYKKTTSYYACSSQKSLSYLYSEREPCNARQIPTKLLDESVFNFLREFFYTPPKIEEYIYSIAQTKNIQKTKTALEQIINTEKELLQNKDVLLRWFRQKILSEYEAEDQLKEIQRQLADLTQIKKTYEAELATAALTDSVAEITTFTKLNYYTDNFTIEEKRAALRSILDQVIAERVDNTYGRGSRPTINAQLKLK